LLVVGAQRTTHKQASKRDASQKREDRQEDWKFFPKMDLTVELGGLLLLAGHKSHTRSVFIFWICTWCGSISTENEERTEHRVQNIEYRIISDYTAFTK